MSLLDTASLIVTPNGYKEGTLYSVIPSDGSGDMSVVRATTATRVNSAGLVELVPYNLVQYSEQFDNAYWLKYQANITANNITAPNGTLTADKVLASANGGSVVYVSNLPLISGTYSYSIYAKAGNQDKIYLEAYGVGGSACSTAINLTTQAIISQSGFTNLNIESVGNGWFRISATFSNLGGSSVSVGFGMATSVVTNDFTYFWGGQINEGTLKDYQKTETRLNIPRLDYSNGTCPTLLVEPQRTNIQTYSEDIAQAFPTILGGTTTANNTTSPSGIVNADKFTVDTSTGLHVLYNSYVSTDGQPYTTSVFLKRGTGRYFLYRILTNLNGFRFGVTIDLETGTILGSNSLGSPTGTNSKIEDYGNGWYRVSLTVNGVGPLLATLLSSSNTATPTLDAYIDYTYTGNGTDSYYIWGAQTEAGSYPTSYIPTTSASVTRNADVVSKTGISSLIGQTEGTIFLDFDYDGVSSNYVLMQLFDSATPFNLIQYYLNSAKKLTFEVGATGAVADANVLTTGRNKIAGAYKANDFVLYINGTQIGTDTSGSVIATNSITFNDFYAIPSTYKQTMDINASAIWKTRLTNTQLAQLTTI